MAQVFLCLLVRQDMPVPANAAALLVRLLTHDAIKTRRVGY